MGNPPTGSFARIATVERAAFETFNMFNVIGVEDVEGAKTLVTHIVETGFLHPGHGGRAIPGIQAAPDGEPRAALIASPNTLRSGIVCTAVSIDGRMTLEGSSVYFSDGVQHRFELTSVLLSQHRGMGILVGVISGGIPISAFEPTFASDRQWHGEGSVHDVMLYGVALSAKIGTPEPLKVKPEVSPDGLLRLDHAALFLPINDLPPSYYSMLGPVKDVRPYDLEMFGAKVWQIRVAITRISDETDVEIVLFVPEHIFCNEQLPVPGQQIAANFRLCTRLMFANWPR